MITKNKQSTVSKQKQRFVPVPIIIILVAVLVIGITYFFGHKNNLGVTLFERIAYLAPSDRINKNDGIAVRNLANNFYKALETQDGKLLFSYFTPPLTSEEKKDFTWLTGADLVGEPIYRAFFRQKISNPKINDVIKYTDTAILIIMTDQQREVPSAGNETGVISPQKRTTHFRVIKSDDKWLVDKFTEPLHNTGNAITQKYSGFGQ